MNNIDQYIWNIVLSKKNYRLESVDIANAMRIEVEKKIKTLFGAIIRLGE